MLQRVLQLAYPVPETAAEHLVYLNPVKETSHLPPSRPGSLPVQYPANRDPMPFYLAHP